MRLRHTHKWRKDMVTYTPPKVFNGEVTGSAWIVERLVCGVTTVLYVCEDPQCGKRETVEMLGETAK